MEEEILSCPFMMALFEGRHEELGNHFAGFKRLICKMCNGAKVVWHEAHLTVLLVEEEIHSFIGEVSVIADKYIRRAINVLQRTLEHIKIMLTCPAANSMSKAGSEDKLIRCIAANGNLKQIDIVMLGHAIHEAAFVGTDVTLCDVCIGLGDFFGIKITEAYVRTAFTDIRNKYRDKKKLFIDRVRDLFIAKIERAIEKSDELYEKQRKAALASSSK